MDNQPRISSMEGGQIIPDANTLEVINAAQIEVVQRTVGLENLDRWVKMNRDRFVELLRTNDYIERLAGNGDVHSEAMKEIITKFTH